MARFAQIRARVMERVLADPTGRFASDPAIVGSAVTINGQALTVIGVGAGWFPARARRASIRSWH